MRLRTLLVPLDGTLFSQAILPAIKHLLRMEDYTIVLLRVGAPVHGVIGVPPRPASMAVPIPTFERAEDLTYSRHPISASQQELNARAELLDSLAPARATLEAAGFAVRELARFGDPATEIVACAEEQQVDMIAMATHDGPSLRRMILGSVAAQVLERSPVPVLLLRPGVIARSEER